MLIGYARVSTDDQDTAAQVAALQGAGCERIFREKASGGRWDQPQFLRLLNQLRSGDVVVVWKLDRLSRSLRDLLTIMEQLREAGAGFRSLTEAIDTTTPAGRMMMQMVGAFAEFERAMLRERTQAGVDAARQQGRVGGRRPKLSPQQQSEIRKMVSEGDKTAAAAAHLPFAAQKRSQEAVRDVSGLELDLECTWGFVPLAGHAAAMPSPRGPP